MILRRTILGGYLCRFARGSSSWSVLAAFFAIAAVAANNVPTLNSIIRPANLLRYRLRLFHCFTRDFGAGPIYRIQSDVSNADSFSVTPSLLSEDEEVLPLSAANHTAGGPRWRAPVFRGAAARSRRSLQHSSCAQHRVDCRSCHCKRVVGSVAAGTPGGASISADQTMVARTS